MPVPLTRPIGWSYDVEPRTGFTYQTNPRANWARTQRPQTLAQPGLNLRPPKVMRDLTNPNTYPPTGGSPQTSAAGMRRLVPPVSQAHLARRTATPRTRGRK